MRIGRPIVIGATPSALVVDLHAAWIASALEHTLQRLDLVGIKLERAHPATWDTVGRLRPDIFLVFAIVLTVLLPIGYLVWRSCNPDAGLPRHDRAEIGVLALDEVYYRPISPGEHVSTVRSRERKAALRFGSSVDVGAGDSSVVTLSRLPPDRSIQHTIELAHSAGCVRHFMMYAPGAGSWLFRAPRRLRIRASTLQQRFESLRPYTLCWLSGVWIVSRPAEGMVSLQLSELVDRDWWRWRPVRVPEAGWLTVTCPVSTLTPLGSSELDGVSRLQMSVLAVPSQRTQDDELHMHLIVGCYEI